MHFLIFFNLANEFLETSHIDKVISAKLPTNKTKFIGMLTCIITSVMVFGPCRKMNLYLFYKSNVRNIALEYMKHYPYNFFAKISIQENSYLFY